MATEAPLVLVTGVSGYIGSWIAAALLHLGYRVRGTVRSLSRKTEHLAGLHAESALRLQLVEADLLQPESWPPAVAGCDYVLHVASPFFLEKPKDPEKELYKPARDGTINVLRAVADASPRPRRVVVTSSIAAVAFGRNDAEGYRYSEKDWTNEDSGSADVGAYIRSKTIAERAAWKFVNELPEDKRFELTTVNPATVFGPVLSKYDCASADIISLLLNRGMPMLPNIFLPAVDIRLVVRTHILAMITPGAAGHRFPISPKSLGMRELGTLLGGELNPKGYKVPTTSMPNWLLRFAAFFDEMAAASASQLGKQGAVCSHEEVKGILGITDDQLHTDLSPALIEMAYSLVTHGLVQDRSRDHSVAAHVPAFGPKDAVSGIPHVGGGSAPVTESHVEPVATAGAGVQ